MGYWERMADLSLRGSEQEAANVRQNWQNIGSIVPQTIGAMQDHAQQEQQMEYYRANQRRTELAMRREQKAMDIERGVDLAISRGYDAETGLQDYGNSIADVLDQNSDTFMGESEYGRHAGAIVEELDVRRRQQKSIARDDYLFEKEETRDFLQQAKPLFDEFLKTHPPTESPIKNTQYGIDYEKFMKEHVEPLMGSSSNPEMARILEEINYGIPRYGGEGQPSFAEFDRDILEATVLAGQTIEQRNAQEIHNVLMSKDASHFLNGNEFLDGVLSQQWMRDNAPNMFINHIGSQEDLDERIGHIRNYMSTKNGDLVIGGLKAAGLLVYDEDFETRVEQYSEAATEDVIDLSGYTPLQQAHYAMTGKEKGEQYAPGSAWDVLVRQRLDEDYRAQTGNESAKPYMGALAEVFKDMNELPGKPGDPARSDKGVYDVALGPMTQRFKEIDKTYEDTEMLIRKAARDVQGGSNLSTINRALDKLMEDPFILRSESGGGMGRDEFKAKVSTPEGVQELLEMAAEMKDKSRSDIVRLVGDEAGMPSREVEQDLMAKWLSAPGNLIVRGETGRDMFPFIPDNVTLPPDMDEDKWRTIVERDPATVTKWALDWYADLDPYEIDFSSALNDGFDPRTEALYRDIMPDVKNTDVDEDGNKSKNYGKMEPAPLPSELLRGDTGRQYIRALNLLETFNDLLPAINKENLDLRRGVFKDFAMDMKEASPADPLARNRQWGEPYIEYSLGLLEKLEGSNDQWWNDGSFFRNYAVQ